MQRNAEVSPAAIHVFELPPLLPPPSHSGCRPVSHSAASLPAVSVRADTARRPSLNRNRAKIRERLRGRLPICRSSSTGCPCHNCV